jgi:hypothetical protein
MMETRRAMAATVLVSLLLGGLSVGHVVGRGDGGSACPHEAVSIEPGESIQAAVNLAGDGATFCLRNGVHRGQSVRPQQGQRFYGEGNTILNGTVLLTDFRREGSYWTATNVFPRSQPHGECLPSAPACKHPEALFLDDRPLVRVMTREALGAGAFHIDYEGNKIVLMDDPTSHKIEATVASVAFESTAAGITISNVTVEKFASAAQQGAIHAREGRDWIIEKCQVRLNSGAGISVGSGSRVRNCDVERNGQIGIEGNGRDIRIENNRVHSNNIYGFDPAWEAGGVKIAECEGVVFSENHVSDNDGPGLWCDIDCRNVVYERNLVENNRHIGILHEISFKAVIRDNVVRHNGRGDRSWFWGADITLAASQDVTVTGNTITVDPGGCGVVLIDQGRRSENGRLYRTQDNIVRANDMTFEGAACAGGTSDTGADSENFGIISRGNNRFDGNTYRVPGGEGSRFVWGADVTDWKGFQSHGLEANGRLVVY